MLCTSSRTPFLLCLLYLQAHNVRPVVLFPAYFFCFWAVYIASAITLFFVALEVFRSALSAFSGLMRFGTVIFRWAAVVSIIVSLAATSYVHKGIFIIPDMAVGLMRSVSVLELCLLAFLCLSMNALRLSVRDLAFGIALGFGMLADQRFCREHALVCEEYFAERPPSVRQRDPDLIDALGLGHVFRAA